ncbi:MAG: beta-lactamase family protein [Robiginitomaculum sp.]|nr:beta-lactamase family protein [Robiginitomaculum sp.]
MNFKQILVLLFFSGWLLNTSAIANDNEPSALPLQPFGQDWPTNNWQTIELPVETQQVLTPLIEQAINGGLSETRSIIIIHQGKIVAEHYADGFNQNTKQISWSMAKSITSAMVGRAVELDMIKDIDQPMPSPWANDDPRAKISWRQWLNMTDGLQYSEIGEPNFAKNDVVQMMFGKGKFDTLSYVKELPLQNEPGTDWNYSSAGYHLLGNAIQKLITEQPANAPIDPALMVEFADSKLFDVLGMDVQLEFDPAGTFMGGSLVWASARDFAKFGYLFLRNGIWDDQRILPENWVNFSTTKTPANNSDVYGAGWWISADSTNTAFSAQGHEGQIIWIDPSRDLVIVRLGLIGSSDIGWPQIHQWCNKIAMVFPEAN